MTTTIWTPTKEELEEMGFEKSGYTDVMNYRFGDSYTIRYHGDQTYTIDWVYFYPRSRSDIEKLIELFNPN